MTVKFEDFAESCLLSPLPLQALVYILNIEEEDVDFGFAK